MHAVTTDAGWVVAERSTLVPCGYVQGRMKTVRAHVGYYSCEKFCAAKSPFSSFDVPFRFCNRPDTLEC